MKDFLEVFNSLSVDNLHRLGEIYTSDIHFIDPAHEIRGLASLRSYFEKLYTNVGSIDFEFQALLGVPMRATLARLRDAGHRVRLYVPFGSEWYAYSVRRLKENPQMAGAIAKGLLKRG